MSFYSPLEQALGIPPVLQATMLSVLLLVGAAVVIRRQLAQAGGGTIPDEGLTLRNAFEIVVEGLADLARGTLGEEWRKWFPLVGTIFFFILVSNLMGLAPGLDGATSSINTTLAWALISVLVAEYAGIRKHGRRYVEHFLGPPFEFRGHHVYLLAPLFVPLELIGHVARVVTLAIRLLANMFADHTIVAVMTTLVPLVIPSLFLGLGVIVAVLQAFVFALLTIVYIGLALEEPH